MFFAFFDYLIGYVLIKNGTLEPPRGVTYHWFTYEAKKGVFDNLKTWRKIGPWGRFLVKSLVLIGATILFIV